MSQKGSEPCFGGCHAGGSRSLPLRGASESPGPWSVWNQMESRRLATAPSLPSSARAGSLSEVRVALKPGFDQVCCADGQPVPGVEVERVWGLQPSYRTLYTCRPCLSL